MPAAGALCKVLPGTFFLRRTGSPLCGLFPDPVVYGIEHVPFLEGPQRREKESARAVAGHPVKDTVFREQLHGFRDEVRVFGKGEEGEP